MDRGDRINLIRKIARRLEDESEVDGKLTLNTFEFPTVEFDSYRGEWYGYLVEQLENGSDAQLTELHRHLFPDEAEPAPAPVDDAAGPWEAGTFHLFISHTSNNRERAGKLSEVMQSWGVNAFVAHDSIEPTRDWQEVIQGALERCHAMCVIVTPDLLESRWCDQEIGFALARRVLIVPLRIGADPHGFIGKFQAISVPVDHSLKAYQVAHRVFDALARNRLTATAMAASIVRRFANSGSFDNTRDVFPLLEGISTGLWTDQMIEEAAKAIITNSQITDAYLPGGRSAKDAATELINKIREQTGHVEVTEEDFAPATGDDDIPF
jgi:hypothetical protein